MIQLADYGKVETGALAVCSRSLCACASDLKGHKYHKAVVVR